MTRARDGSPSAAFLAAMTGPRDRRFETDDDGSKSSLSPVENGRRAATGAAPSLRSGKRHLCVEKTCGRAGAREECL